MKTPRILSFGRSYHTEELYLWVVGYDDFLQTGPLKVPHKQDGYTFHLIVRGSGSIHIGGKVFHAEKGDCFFLPPDETMMYFPDESDPWAYFWFYLHGSRVETLARRLGFSTERVILPCRETELLSQMLWDLIREENSGDGGYFLALSLFMRLTAALCPRTESVRRDTAALAEQVRTLITLNYRNPDFRVEDLARMANISHPYLCRLFREATGSTPVAWLTATRLQAAGQILREEERVTVRELCHRSGFRDDIHFAKAFRRYYGMTVGQYRAQARQGQPARGRAENA